jgi:hypothetical protein
LNGLTIYEHEKEIRNLFDKQNKIQPTCMIEYQGEKGIVFQLGENLATGTWLSGDIIVFWEDGDQTTLPEDGYIIINENLWI